MNEKKYEMIFCIVNSGFSSTVMDAAKEAGVRAGGLRRTVCRSVPSVIRDRPGQPCPFMNKINERNPKLLWTGRNSISKSNVYSGICCPSRVWRNARNRSR